MEYKDDPILPIIVGYIEKFEQRCRNMTREELVELVQLRPEQKKQIREADH